MSDKKIVDYLRGELIKLQKDENSEDPIVICHLSVPMFKRMAEVFIGTKGGE